MNEPVTCFLIDDDEDDQELFTLALKKVDPSLTCVVADDCGEALKKLRQEENFWPQYIFLDLNMPRMHGKQCLIELKKIARIKHIPIIIYSTSSEPKDIQETKALGAADFLTKPPLISTLTARLANLLLNRPMA
ncbi:response regulator [Larkinella arboricola]|uniref:Response regulator receiver domain-containing protein n=1 Tax=Larkinella arboricola TaxID=643671 RepID=A0A327WQA2_LARAB|nr:response regulator [Larkinella arboricola]RAJ94538.1 response regulator receiver domain-containing protein [Larkinella arboricola]